MQFGEVLSFTMLGDEFLQRLDRVGECRRTAEFLLNFRFAEQDSRPFGPFRQRVIRVSFDEIFELLDADWVLSLCDLLRRLVELSPNLFAVDHEPKDESHDRQQSAATSQDQHQRRTHHLLFFEPLVLRKHRPQ